MEMYIPNYVDRELREFTDQDVEVQGAFIYRKLNPKEDNSGDIFVSTHFITGYGTRDNVQAQPSRHNALEKFLRYNKEFDYTIFHTHSRGTIEEYGDLYLTRFSEGDMRGIREVMEKHSGWWEILVTPAGYFHSVPNGDMRFVVDDWEEDDKTSWIKSFNMINEKLDKLLWEQQSMYR